MSRPARSRPSGKREVDDYRHDEAQRLNNPEAGLARYETEKPPTKRYESDPHMDPQLVWAGKAERTSFDVDAVSIHVHERLSTEAIIKTLHKKQPQLALFGDPELDRGREVEFYQHEVDWTNRLILGDSMVVMASLLERERLAGQANRGRSLGGSSECRRPLGRLVACRRAPPLRGAIGHPSGGLWLI